MLISKSGHYALTVFVTVAMLVGCSGGRSQLVPAGVFQQPSAAQFDLKELQSTVARATHLVSPDGIIYTPAEVQIENSQYSIDLEHDGRPDFIVRENNTFGRSSCFTRKTNFFGKLTVSGGNYDGVEIANRYAARLSSGSPIGHNQQFFNSIRLMEQVSVTWGRFRYNCVEQYSAVGNWPASARIYYLGLAFLIHGQTHYGWAAITVSSPQSGWLAATLSGYAYQTKAGKSIMAGQM